MWCPSHSSHLIKEEYEVNGKGHEQSQHSHVVIIPSEVTLQDENPEEEMMSEHVRLLWDHRRPNLTATSRLLLWVLLSSDCGFSGSGAS